MNLQKLVHALVIFCRVEHRLIWCDRLCDISKNLNNVHTKAKQNKMLVSGFIAKFYMGRSVGKHFIFLKIFYLWKFVVNWRYGVSKLKLITQNS